MKKILMVLSALVLFCYACKEDEPLTLTLEGQTSYTIPMAGQEQNFKILSNTTWTVSSDANWCTMNGKQTATGTGDATITLSVAENKGYTTRTATISISAQGVTEKYTVSVSQQGVTPTFSVSDPTGWALTGGESQLTITTNVNWTVAKNAEATWCTLSTTNGTGSGTLTLTAVANNNPSSRKVTLTFTPAEGLPVKTVEITQLGEDPELIISPETTTRVANAENQLTVTVTSNLTFSVTPNDAWITNITPAPMPVQQTVVSKQVVLKIEKNNTSGRRTGTVTFAGGSMSRTLTIEQESLADADSIALHKIYTASSTAAAWPASLTNWGSNNPINTWKGVTLNADKRVVKLDLGIIGSSGGASTPVTIADTMDFSPLTELTRLVVAARTGSSIPTSIGSLKKLEYLRIKSCITNGNADIAIPDNLYNATNLHYLELTSFSSSSGTSFIGASIVSDIAKLTKLDTLILTGNKIFAIPAEIASLTSLVMFEMKNNWPPITLPNAICSLTTLKRLDMTNANITGTIPDNIGNLTNLEYLDLSSNKFTVGTATIPTSICNLTKLKTLNLNSTQLTGSIPTNIGNLTALITLNLSNNKMTGAVTSPGLSGEIPSSIGSLTNLTSLQLKNNSFSGTLPGEIGNLDKLTGQFDVSDNALTGIGLGVGQLKNAFLIFSKNKLSSLTETTFPNATNLNFSDNEFTAESFPASINAPKLTNITLSNNKLTHLPAGVLSIATITGMTIGGNPFDATAMASDNLSALTNLTTLNFTNCTTITAIPSCMKTAAPSLITLNLDGCRVAAIPDDANLFTTLKTLSMQNNEMSSLPANIKKMPALENINLTGNKFTDFPMELVDLSSANLNSLKSITLTNNQITGAIPAELSRLANLNILMLAGNKLTGTIPYAIFDKEVAFATFNVMSNQLTGFDFTTSDPNFAEKMAKIKAPTYKTFCPQLQADGTTAQNPCPFTAYGL